MITTSMTQGYDNDLILVAKINLDSEIMYFSDCEDKITLSGIDFDGKVILNNSISEATKDIDVINGGTIGQVGNLDLALARYTSYNNGTTTFNNFFNDFYPATSKPLLTSKTVDIGVVWSGATATSEITWMYQFYIEDYSWDDHALYLSCIEYDELVAKQLPYYVIQNENDNGVGYFATASESDLGQVLPLLYGDFAYLNLDYEDYRLAPTIRSGVGHTYKASSHICKEVDSGDKLYLYVDKVKTMMQLSVTSPTNTNTRAGHSILLTARKAKITGEIKIIPRAYLESPYGGTDLNNCIDKDASTYGTIGVNTTSAFKFGTDFSRNELGEFSGITAENSFVVMWDANGGNVDFQIKYYHPQMGVNSGYSSRIASASRSGTNYTEIYSFGDGNYDYGSNPKKWADTAEWDESELQVLHFDVLNQATSTGSMRVKHLYFHLQNIAAFFAPEVSGRRSGRNTGGQRGIVKSEDHRRN